ncbi:serine/threonine-protein kinase haspin [Gymnodraco acuticeps]|uniref:Serine/threonine-protein kinase haspin n=1 Tax=Gymnodraco acuticeps TaxID=8218 RepID=A0A6P8TTN0_GYMAC|nr:serine/threonine-protein kinase haspin [Gymnodraco acuticeps]XP_034067583.1 serine/threonine-protein kinase haspin [Gymnodraco acuticeps]XP_034067584.1 serine/threonine-protein kinase haspin [Gymnodraco acuticeps]XP_034067585.1 serine/threonine-protein kinase haspin [Gymnodraco acuticeps]
MLQRLPDFPPNPIQEISLNESTEHSLAASPRKPIFCSTPSAGSFIKRPHLEPLSVTDQSSSLSFLSVSGVGVTFQEDLASPGRPFSPPCSSPSLGLHLEEKPKSSLCEQKADLDHHEELSDDLLVESKGSSCGKGAKKPSEDIKTKDFGELPSLIQLSTDYHNQFVSAADELEFMIEALKEQCLTERCSVYLERFGDLTISLLCGKTTISSCLADTSVAHSLRTSEHPSSVDGCQPVDPSQSLVPSFHPSVSASSGIDSQSSISYPSAELSSTQTSMEKLASVLEVESTHNKNSSVEFLMETQFPANHIKDECVNKKGTVSVRRSDTNKSGNDKSCDIKEPEGPICSGEISEGGVASVRHSINNSGPVDQTHSNDRETEEKAAQIVTVLKERCLRGKVNVKVKRLTRLQLKECPQLKDAMHKSPTVVADLNSDDQPQNAGSESDTKHCNEDISARKANVKKRGTMCSTSSEDKIVKTVPKGKMMSLAPEEKKKKSMDQPGTTRKACVSGLSVSRWKNKGSSSKQKVRGSTAQASGNTTVDCSINELMSTQHKKPQEPSGNMNFFTPVRGAKLNLSYLLADLTPNTHTWSRLKAALSVHRMVKLTLGSLRLSESSMSAADLSQDLFATPFRTPFPKHLRSKLQCCDSPLVCEDLSDAEKVYAECGQHHTLPWEECILPQRMKQCVKIGEGTFGEVFSITNASGDKVALKVIPVEGSEKVNGQDQKTYGEILHEIIISKDLSSLKDKQQNKTHGFIGLNDLHCVQGCYPPDFMNAWDTFDKNKVSENDRPDFFEKDQLFIILEFEFGGTDLENSDGMLSSLSVAKGILHQVTAALAVAEQELHFEHRDLHWGNVLVQTTKEKRASFLLNGAAHSLETKGVLVRIIDYSLSRLEIDGLTVSCDISNDEELFMGQGDYQFEIYRLMRQENGNNWSNYHPHSNVLWLHYLCSKLLSMKYRSIGGRGLKAIRKQLTCFYDNVLQYSSAMEVLQKCPMLQ